MTTDLKRRNHVRLIVHWKVINVFYTVAPRREQILEHVVHWVRSLAAIPVLMVVARIEAKHVAAQMVEIQVMDNHQVSFGGGYYELLSVPGDATSHEAVDVKATPENNASITCEATSHTHTQVSLIYLLTC